MTPQISPSFDEMRQALDLSPVGEAEERPGVAGREHPGSDTSLHERRQSQQSEGVRDLRP